MTDYKEVVGTGGKALTFDQVDLERAKDYSCEDADVTLQLSHLLLPKLKKEGFRISIDQVEIPLVVVLAKMEMNGVKIDIDLLNEFSKEMESQLQQKIGAHLSIWPGKSLQYQLLPTTGEDPLR